MAILGILRVLMTAETEKFTKDMKSGQKAVSSFKSEWTNMAKGLAGAFTAGAVVAGIKDIVSSTANYAKQVEDLSRNLGVSTVEASKMIQMTDDLEISQSALEMGMKTALRQGIMPNIEGIKDLASQYQALNTPAEKAAFALKTFGKNGLEMAKILEKTPEQIQEMADALEGSSLIMGEEAVQAAKDYRLSLDNLEDSVMGLKVSVGNELLPVLTEYANKGAEIISVNMRLVNVEQALQEAVKDGTLSRDKYNELIKGTATAAVFGKIQMKGLAKAEEEADAILKEYRDSTMDARDRIAELIPVLGDEAEAMDEVKSATDLAKEAQDNLKSSLSDLQGFVAGPLASETENYKGKIDDLNEKLGDTAGKIEELNKKKHLTDEQKTQLGELQTEYGEIIGEIDATAVAHDEATKKILFNILTQRASMDGLSGSELEILTGIATSWGLVDQATANYTLNADARLTALAMGAGIQETKAALMDIDTMTRSIPRDYDINFHINYSTSGEPPSNIKNPVRPRRAAGGPVMAGYPYDVGEGGTETFVPDQNGTIINNNDRTLMMKNSNADIIAAIYASKINEAKLARMIRDAVLKVV